MPRKRIVVCFDGTWNAADSARGDTNVERIARAVRGTSGADGVPQHCLYLRGVGTSGTDIDRVIAGATGQGIEEIIRSAYMFIAQNYLPARNENGTEVAADEIFLFGYSRGAFAARSLAGLMSAVGILKRQSLGHLMTAWHFYRTARTRNPAVFLNKYRARGIDTHAGAAVTFLGVWDTVGALGIPVGILGQVSNELHGFHNTEPSGIVKYGAQALAIDEPRDEFVPTFWTGTPAPGTTIEQVWFAGCHSDVGGGNADRALADIPLAWMAARAETQGLQLDWAMLPDRAALDPLAPLHDPRQGWSVKDFLTPTIRRVAERDIPVTAFERLYRPMGRNGKILRTINESIHPSVLERWGKAAWFSPSDKASARKRRPYAPKNLAPFFDAAGNPRHGTPVAG